ncbi:MAG: glycosyl hydrolase family 28 protein [Acidobacteriota bacterium]
MSNRLTAIPCLATVLSLAAMFAAAPASASITLDATSSTTAASPATTFTFNHVLGAGGNRLVVCTVAMSNPTTAFTQAAPTVTFGGVTMTEVAQAPGSAQNSPKVEGAMFWANDSTLSGLSGSQVVSVTIPGSLTVGAVAGCSSYFGAAQSGPESSGVSYNGSGTAPSVTLSVPNAGDLVVDSLVGGFTASTNPTKSASPTTPQTALYNTQLSTSGVLGGSSYYFVPSGTSFAASWTPGSSGPSRSTYSAIAFAAAPTTNYTVSTSVLPVGGGTVTLNPTGGSYASGSNVTVTAVPAIGYTFNNFTGALTGSTNPQTLSVNGNKSVTANFTASLCTLSTSVIGSGSVTLSPTAANNAYVCGTQVTVTGVADSGNSFGEFTGALTGATNGQVLSVNTSTSVTATFVSGTACHLTTSTTGSGTLTVSPTGDVFSCGTQLTLTATPAQYFTLTGFGGALSGTTSPQNFTINADSTISAAFAQTNFPIHTTIVGPGTVTANPLDTGNGYPANTQVTLTATPTPGANFSGFTGDLTGATSPQTITVNATKNVTATFVAQNITKDAVSSAASKATASSLSWQHVLGAGGARAVVIAVAQTDSIASPDASSVVTSVLFNGVYATPIPNSLVYGGTSGSVQAQLFYLLEPELPAAGTYTITVNLAGSVAGIQAGAVSFFGVSQGPPDAVANHKDTSGADLISTAITTLSANDVVLDVVEDNNVAALTANSGQTLAWTASAAVGTGGSSTEVIANPGVATLGWAGSASRLVHSLAAFAPATSTAPATHTLTTSVAGGVGGTVATNPGLTTLPVSTGVLLTATATTGYAFAGWTGDYTSTTNPLPITMDSDRNVVANFTTAATCNLTFNVIGSGTVTPAPGVYNCGTTLHLVATPGSGYTFTSYGGDFSSSSNPADFTISADSTISVQFDPIPQCTLNLTTSGQGSVTPASGNYACGTVLTLTATAAGGSAFSGYTGDLATTSNPATVILSQNMSIVANFTSGPACTLTTSVTGQGVITPSSGSYACGTTIAIEADPASKYLFNGWGGDLSGMTSPTTLTLNTNKNVTAAFVVNTAGVTGDPRTVVEPTYPAVCTVLTALQSVSAPVETSPDTTRVQAALNACPVGKAVEFSASPDGAANAFIIAPITIPAGVTMLVDPEVTILGSIKSTDYTCVTSSSWCTPLIDIAANNAPNPGSAIMGLGVIDGRGGTPLTDKGKSWWATGSDVRPRLVFLNSHSSTAPADNFTMYKITLKNSPKFEFSGIGNNLIIWGVKVYAPPDSPNTDGLDPSGSQNITITNSYISDGDDMIAMKAGNGHVANVTISNNHMYSGHGITVGSETNAGLNNMLVVGDAIDNGFGGSSFDSLRIKSDTSRGGEVYDVLYKNICINHGGDTIVIDPYYSSQTGSLIPNFHDITFSNVHKLIHDSAHKSTWIGYNTNGTINPVTITLDSVYFDGDAANDFKAPDNVNNVQFTFGPGPVSMANFFTADAAVPTNLVTVINSVSNSNGPLDCSAAFVYLAGDLTAPSTTVTAGSSPRVTAVLQNVVSPLVAGTIVYPQQNAPTGTIQLLEGSTVVANGTISGRVMHFTVPSITAGPHSYTAKFLGDGNYAALSFGSITLTANNPAPTADNQNVSVSYNAATPITLTATGSGTITYAVVTNPAHGALSGTAPSLTYTPTAGYTGADSFTFTASNGTVSAPATISITVAGTGSQSQTITFPAPPASVTYGDAAVSLTATASSSLPVAYSISGPGSLTGSLLSYTGIGTITITASQAGNGTYTAATPVQRSIQVNPSVLNVGVFGSPTRYFGAPNPAFNYTLGTFLNGDTQATATTGAPILTTTATPKSDAGNYPINVSLGSLLALNYNFNLVPGQLIVTGGAAQSIFFPPIPNLANGATILILPTATSGLPVTLQVTGGSASLNGNLLTVTGTGTVQVTASQVGNSDFAAATSVSQTFTAH